MRIAFFVNRFPVVSEAFITNAAAGLIDAGHAVDIYAMVGRGDARHGRHALVSEYGLERHARVMRHREHPRRRLAASPLAAAQLISAHPLTAALALDRSTFGREAGDLTTLHEAAMFRRRGRYDILHCQFATLADTVLNHRNAGFLSGKVFVHFRGYDISNVVQERGEGVYDRVFEQADGFAADCDYFRDRALRLGAPADRFAIFPCGVALASFPFKARRWSPGEPVNLLSVGRLVEKKGLRHAIGGVAALARDGLDMRFVIMGDGPLHAELEAQARAEGLSDRITFTGAATHDQIASAFDEAHIFIAPSTTATNGDQDGPLNTLKEAMACGCPFVTTDHGGIPELVGGVDAGVMVREADADAIAQGLRDLLSRHSDWERMGAVGRAHIAAHHSIDVATQGALGAYAATLARSSRPTAEAATHVR
ncbi:MAG: glycosyltransferase [Phenylobacterium sp.]|uniref:glycosyltransferase n=1 Tax=Phenylobacterium sp. TaxID=1871053 RepID=UPI0027344F52|nr:glycosyltransferase [Phenylobacterium sp.]MDP3174863.1 glycosyltransferase [Phenylobacterium sp.]